MKKYLVFIFAYFFLFLSFIPNFYEISVSNLVSPDRTMVQGEHIYTYDYNVYISKIRQGQEGRMNIVDKYDNHPEQKGVFLQMFYLTSGRITKIFNISPTATYQLLRIVMSVFWISTIIFLNIYFLRKISLINLGVIFSLLTASFPVFYRFENQWWVTFYMNWWQELDVMKRISFIPHDVFNYISIAILSILLSLTAKNKGNKYLPVICLLLFISVFIQPSSALLFLVSWTLYHLILTIWSKSLEKDRVIILIKQTSVIFISILIPILYIKTSTSIYPWKSLLDFDQNNRLSVNIRDYVFSFGPVFFTGMAGLVLVLLKKKQELLSLVTWIIGVSVLLILFKFFPYQSELRFVQTANHIPLAILSVYFLKYLFDRSKNLITTYSIYIVVILIIFLGAVQGYFSLRSQTQFINQRAIATIPLVPYPPQVMYPMSDFYNGLKWLETNTDHKTVVLSKITAGNYIPAFSGNFVYLGHSGETPNFEKRTEKVNEFFSGNLPENQAFKFLKTENIRYVFYGPQEKENSLKDIGNYKFLAPVYKTKLVTIYEYGR
ncbi:MAG: hypothetical protein WC741_03280 [Patescibacteria group bacterium]|jgi:hypothetical protein